MNPFSLAGSFWIFWFLIVIVLAFVELIYKKEVGTFSVAAFVTIFPSFFVPTSSQVLIFSFFTMLIFVSSHVRKEHHSRLRQNYLH
jgi:hypothetical protein